MARAGEHTRRKRQHWRETSNDSRAVRWREFREERERRQSEEEERYAAELNRRAEEISRNEEQKRLDSLRQKKAEEERLRTQQAEEEKRYIAELNRRAEERRQQEERKQAEAIRRRQEETEALRKKYTSSSTRTGTVTGYVLTSDYSPSSVAPQKFDTSFSRLKKGLSSSVTESDFLGVTGKRNLPDGGVQQTVLIKDSAVANKSLERAETGIATDISLLNQLPDDAEPFQKFKGVTYAGQEAFFGKKAKKAFEQLIKAQMGGKVDWDGDVAHYEYALGEDFVKEQEKKGLNPAGVFETKAFAKARAQSSKAEEQVQKEEQAKKSESSKSKTIGLGLKIVAGIVALTDIARRILTAVLDKVSKERSDFISGASLGVSAVDVRNYRNIEKAKGLPEGSFMGLLSDLQANFGDERHINEDALTEIAPYIPEAVVPLVRAGKMNLQELAKIILDKAQSLIEEGKNWRGEEVGVTEARRSILTSLGRFSPHAKAIAENMVDTDLYGVFAGQAKGVDAYLEAGVGAKTKFSETELAQYKEVVQLVDGIKGQFKTIKDDIMTDIVRSFSGIANFLYNLDIGKSDEEKLKDQVERRDRTFQSMTEMTNIKSTMSTLIGSRLAGLDLTSIGGKDFDSVDSMLAYMMKHPAEFMAKLKGSSAYAPLRSILSSEEVVSMLGAYKIAEESYKELEKQSKKPIDKIKYNYTDYTQVGMALRAEEDPFIQEFKRPSTPWEAHQYALSSDKGYSALVSEPDLFDDFGEILTYIQEASTKKMTEDRDLNMRQVLDKFSTYLSGQTGHYVGIRSEAGVSPRSSVEAVRNINSYLKGMGYKLTESDFDKLNSIIMEMGDEDAFRRVTGIDWSEKDKIAPYQRGLDERKGRLFEQAVSALISASEGGVLLNAMADAIRKATEKGWDTENTKQDIRLSSLDEGKLKIDVTVNNEAKRDGFTVSADSRLTMPTLTDKIDFSLNVNNR